MISNMSFLASKLIQLSLLYPTLYTFQPSQIYLLIGVTILSLLFVYLGAKIRSNISQQKFNLIIFTILMLLGCNALWQGMELI